MMVARCIIGVFLLLCGIWVVATGGPLGPFLALPFAIGSGLCFYPFFAAPLVNAFSALFEPKGGRALPEQFSKARSLMAQQQFAEAEQELRAMLADRPELVEGTAMLTELLAEHLNRPEDALQVADAELRRGRWHVDHERLTMLAADILLDAERKDDAVELLKRMAAKARGKRAAARMMERLSYLQT